MISGKKYGTTLWNIMLSQNCNRFKELPHEKSRQKARKVIEGEKRSRLISNNSFGIRILVWLIIWFFILPILFLIFQINYFYCLFFLFRIIFLLCFQNTLSAQASGLKNLSWFAFVGIHLSFFLLFFFDSYKLLINLSFFQDYK